MDGGGAGGQGWFVDVIMILNIKTCFNKKVTLLALVPVL